VEAVAKVTNSKIVGRFNPLEHSVDDFWGVGENIKDWKDGVFTKAFREINNESCNDDRKLIVIEAEWTATWAEPLNGLLDDNKKLTLASGAVIKLHPSVRIILLTRNARVSSPAIVSRIAYVYLQTEEEFAPLASFSDSVVSNLKSLGSADYMAHKKVMMALAMISAMHYGEARDELLNLQQTADFAKNYLSFNSDMAGFKFMIKDTIVLSVPSKL